MQKQAKYIFLITFLIAGLVSQAQVKQDTLKREVEVTKAYTPTISDANKLNSMPEIDEEEADKPTFNYNIKSQPVFSTFSVTPLKAATIETTPPIQKGYGLVRAGLGTYYKPYGEIFFNNLNSKNTVFGIHAMHLSSFGDVKLKGGDKVDAPFMNNEVELFLKHTVQQSILSVDLTLNHDVFNYYGYPEDPVPAPLLEDEQSINYFGTKQAFTKGGVHIDLDDPGAEMDEEEFGFQLDYYYFGTKTEQRENFANLTFNMRRPLTSGVGLLDAGVEFAQVSNITLPADTAFGKTSSTILFAKPAWYIGDEKANVTLGLNAWFILQTDEETQAKLAPRINANWAPVEEILKIYAGIDGAFQHNHYSKIAYENPFVNPDHHLKNSMQQFRFYGGFDGKMSKRTTYKISGEYAINTDKPLYFLNENYYFDAAYNPAPLIADNTFDVLYDDMNRLKLNAEILYASSKKMDLSLSVNYYSYKMDKQEEAWNLPTWDATIALGYKVTEQLSVSADIYLIGDRKALIIEESGSLIPEDLPIRKSYTLDPAFDLNLKGNYQLTNKFSVFAQLNNFGFQQYERWFGYPVQSFNALAGISYAF
ncbi:hypothetical protein [Maribellus sediminis]|uniref:hypothetical protein n=1 Tax=Maribellus sediminis TaxID=2696285 RepID=UPI0014303676|nr:hypothetical protein [Maribellus sediminis]